MSSSTTPGRSGASPLELTPDAEHHAMFETNYFGAIRCIQAVLPAMRERGRGAIVNVTSVTGIVAIPNQIAYSASKWALECAGEALAHEVWRFGVRVINVEPGVVMTKIFENSAGATRYDKASPYQPLMRRNGKFYAAGFRNPSEPEDVARASSTPSTRNRIACDGPSARMLPVSPPDVAGSATRPGSRSVGTYPTRNTTNAWPSISGSISIRHQKARGGSILTLPPLVIRRRRRSVTLRRPSPHRDRANQNDERGQHDHHPLRQRGDLIDRRRRRRRWRWRRWWRLGAHGDLGRTGTVSFKSDARPSSAVRVRGIVFPATPPAGLAGTFSTCSDRFTLHARLSTGPLAGPRVILPLGDSITSPEPAFDTLMVNVIPAQGVVAASPDAERTVNTPGSRLGDRQVPAARATRASRSDEQVDEPHVLGVIRRRRRVENRHARVDRGAHLGCRRPGGCVAAPDPRVGAWDRSS